MLHLSAPASTMPISSLPYAIDERPRCDGICQKSDTIGGGEIVVFVVGLAWTL